MNRRNFLRSLAATALVGLGMRLPKAIESLVGKPEPKEQEIRFHGVPHFHVVDDLICFSGFTEPSSNGVFRITRRHEDGSVSMVRESPRTV